MSTRLSFKSTSVIDSLSASDILIKSLEMQRTLRLEGIRSLKNKTLVYWRGIPIYGIYDFTGKGGAGRFLSLAALSPVSAEIRPSYKCQIFVRTDFLDSFTDTSRCYKFTSLETP